MIKPPEILPTNMKLPAITLLTKFLINFRLQARLQLMLLQAASTRCPLPSHAVHPFRKSASTVVSVPSQYALLILVCRQANVHSAIVLQLVQHITVEELASRGGGDGQLLASFQERSGKRGGCTGRMGSRIDRGPERRGGWHVVPCSVGCATR